jgi:uncharacterized protein
MQATIKTYFSLIFFFLLMVNGALKAQENEKVTYRMVSRATTDSVILRWAPMDYSSWIRGNKCGYVVVRYTLIRNKEMLADKEFKILTPQPLKPWPLEKWEPLSETDDYAGIAAQAIYGEDFTPEAQNESPALNIFNQATEQQNRFSFSVFAADMSVNTARGMALYFADHNVKKGEKYVYKVYPACADTVSCDTAFIFTGPDEYVPLIKPVITQVEAGNNTVTMQWKSPEGRWGYTAFDIERSADEGKTFTKINKAPMVNTLPENAMQDYNFYIDSLPDNEHTYYYRLRGLTPFGEKGPFTDTIPVKGKQQLSITPHITNYSAGPKGVTLTWEVDKKAEKRITGFRVMRSGNINKGWVVVYGKVDAASRTFTDAKPISTAYYKISAYDKTGNSSTSFPVLVQLEDSIPPDAPVGLVGKVDTTGEVTIHWHPNKEEDIYGYRIYRGNALFEEFSQITVRPVSDTIFKDKISLKTLTSHVYYKVMAVDKRQNFSKLSAPLELKRPDVIPPVSPVVTDIYSASKGVTITFVHSTSNDVKKEFIMRRPMGSLQWDTCANITKVDSIFTDTLGVAKTKYEYTLIAIDESGLVSQTAQVITALKLAAPPAKPELKVIPRKTESYIELQWKPIPGGRFQIYRAEDFNKLGLYTAIGSNTSGFSDKNVKPGHTYKYQLKYVGNDGVAMGNSVEVKY